MFVADTPMCAVWLNELRKKQVIKERVKRNKLMEHAVRKLAPDDAVMDGEMMIDKR